MPRRHSAEIPFLVAILLALLPSAAACGSGGGGPPAAAITDGGEASIGPAGGELAITSGPLRGLRLTVPAGALAAPVTLHAVPGIAEARPGFRPLGRAVRFLPEDVVFRLPAELELPTQSGLEVVVLGRSAPGPVREIGAATVTAAETVQVLTTGLGLLWPAERLFGGLSVGDYLPLQDQDSWQFEEGWSLSMAMTFVEPNFDGGLVFRLALQRAAEPPLGLYLTYGPFGGAALLGDFAEGPGGGQRLHEAMPLLPGQLTLGQGRLLAERTLQVAPFGGRTPAAVGLLVRELTAGHERERETPLGTFPDALVLDLRTTTAGVGGSDLDELRLVLARNVGPVGLRLRGRDVGLLGGTVGGAPITPP